MITDTELREFLKRADRLTEPALLFAPRLDVDRLMRVLESVFGNRHVFVLRATGPIPSTDSDVIETIRNSFDGRGILAVLMNDKPSPPVVQAVARLCNDGVLAEKKDGLWTHIKPPDDWRMMVLAEVDRPDVLPGGLGELFPAVLAL